MTISTSIAEPSKQVIPPTSTFLSDVKDWMSESAIFAWQFIRNPKTLGTPFVLSSFVAKKLTSHVSCLEGAEPLNYLEVGAGTGAVSSYLVMKLRPQDKLHLVEIDAKLCEVLKRKFEKIHNVFIHNVSIQDWKQADHSIDAIISTIPLNSLPSKDVLESILATYTRLIKNDGVVSFVEYVGTSTMSKTVVFGKAREAYEALQKTKRSFFETNFLESTIIVANIPPARVIHCKINTN